MAQRGCPAISWATRKAFPSGCLGAYRNKQEVNQRAEADGRQRRLRSPAIRGKNQGRAVEPCHKMATF